jgi:hypothetical protein
MSRLNFTRLMALEPTVYHEFTNSLDQRVLLVEHPTLGQDAPVVCVFPDLKLAFASDFFDCDDMIADHKEYEPVVLADDFYHGL